uniref:Uncharacterized protein n=1 Tax=Schizaphis graminum TaxID=13262 RepID=A0A2S2NY73_SCHGA
MVNTATENPTESTLIESRESTRRGAIGVLGHVSAAGKVQASWDSKVVRRTANTRIRSYGVARDRPTGIDGRSPDSEPARTFLSAYGSRVLHQMVLPSAPAIVLRNCDS